MKVCSRCRECKELSAFGPSKTKVDGYRCYCRACDAEYNKARRRRSGITKLTHEERRIIAKRKEQKIAKRQLIRCEGCGKMKLPDDYPKNCSRPGGIDHKCKECLKLRHRAWRCMPGSKEKEKARREAYKETPKGKAVLLYHTLVRKGFSSKKFKSEKYLGASPEYVLDYLAKTYEDRYGEKYTGQEVHIDHKIPISKARNIEEARYLTHYTNLQFLKPEDNYAKKDKILPEFLDLWKKFLQFRNSLDFASQVC